MKIWTDITAFSAKNPVLTIGSFDGVHLGHKQILNQLKELAKGVQGESVLLTFSPHPASVLHPERPFVLLTTLDEKIELLRNYGIDHLVIIHFTKEFSQLPYDEFVESFLKKKIGIHTFLVGYDNRIGKNKGGDFENLEKLSHKYGFCIEKSNQLLLNDEKLSSTQIRKLLSNGELSKASEFLGYPYVLSGKVVKGQHVGSQLGFPTANIAPPANKFIPANGVYAIKARFENKPYAGMLNIGFRPTIKSEHEVSPVIEAHLFDFDRQIYGRHIELFIIKKLRDEQKFNSLDDLRLQLQKDKQEALRINQQT